VGRIGWLSPSQRPKAGDLTPDMGVKSPILGERRQAGAPRLIAVRPARPA
jgi:hypothetical protein